MDDRSCAGLPVIVGGLGKRSVVSAASYEARAYGCRAAMPMEVACRLCPDAIIRPVRMWRYREISECFMDVLRGFSPLVEPLSLDEAFVDLTGTERLFGAPRETVRRIVERVRDITGLDCSVGLAPCKFVAKIASDLRKPRGTVVVDEGLVKEFLAPLEIGRMWGVGPVAEERFRMRGYRHFSDLQNATEAHVQEELGDEGRRAKRLAEGIDPREIEMTRSPKSIGQEETFERDILDVEKLRATLLGQTEAIALRLRRQGLAARTITVKLRFADFTTVTRRTTLDHATDVGSELWANVRAIFDAWIGKEARPLRLIGVTLAGLEDHRVVGGLFPDRAMDRRRRLDGVADAVRNRFGDDALTRAAASMREGE